MYEKLFSLFLSTYFIPLPEAWSKPCQTTKMQLFAITVND